MQCILLESVHRKRRPNANLAFGQLDHNFLDRNFDIEYWQRILVQLVHLSTVTLSTWGAHITLYPVFRWWCEESAVNSNQAHYFIDRCVIEGQQSIPRHLFHCVTQCTALSDNEDRIPSPFDRMYNLLTEHWLVGRRNGQPVWFVVGLHDLCHRIWCPAWLFFWKGFAEGFSVGLDLIIYSTTDYWVVGSPDDVS